MIIPAATPRPLLDIRMQQVKSRHAAVIESDNFNVPALFSPVAGHYGDYSLCAARSGQRINCQYDLQSDPLPCKLFLDNNIMDMLFQAASSALKQFDGGSQGKQVFDLYPVKFRHIPVKVIAIKQCLDNSTAGSLLF